MYVIIAILIFGILIAIHEFGHFITAKLCGVRVLEFSICMGPLLWSRQGEETAYSLRLLPIGGFCAMEGEDTASDDPRAFNNQNPLKKILILAAGAGMNFLLGFLLIVAVLTVGHGQTPEITAFMEGCPYEGEDALQVGDVFWKIDGHRIYVTADVSMYLADGDTHDLVVKRDGETVTLENMTLTKREYPGETQLRYGFYFGAQVSGVGETLRYSWYQSLYYVRSVWDSLRGLVSGMYGVNDLSGVVGIVDLMSDVGHQSASAFYAFLNLANLSAFIAINLAVMNLLPIPALDGGRIFFLIVLWPVEKILGRKLDPKYEGYVHTVGLMLLMALMIYVTLHDVIRIFG